MKLKLFNQKIQEIKWKIEEMHWGNDPHTLTFDTSVDLTISEDDAEFSDENEQVLDLGSFNEQPLFEFEKGKHWRNISDIPLTTWRQESPIRADELFS